MYSRTALAVVSGSCPWYNGAILSGPSLFLIRVQAAGLSLYNYQLLPTIIISPCAKVNRGAHYLTPEHVRVRLRAMILVSLHAKEIT